MIRIVSGPARLLPASSATRGDVSTVLCPSSLLAAAEGPLRTGALSQASCSGRSAGVRQAQRRRSGDTQLLRAIAPPSAPAAGSRLGDNCEAVMQSLRDVGNLRNCLGKELLPEEIASVTKCLDSAHLGVDSCMVDGLPALRRHLMRYLAEAASSQTDDLELVCGRWGKDKDGDGDGGNQARRCFCRGERAVQGRGGAGW